MLQMGTIAVLRWHVVMKIRHKVAQSRFSKTVNREWIVWDKSIVARSCCKIARVAVINLFNKRIYNSALEMNAANPTATVRDQLCLNLAKRQYSNHAQGLTALHP